MNGWYYRDQNGEVIGPLPLSELREVLKEQPDSTPVSPAGAPDWKPLSEWSQSESDTATAPAEKPDMRPTLDRFRQIVRFASDRELIREYMQFLDDYDREERRILNREIEDRKLQLDDPP